MSRKAERRTITMYREQWDAAEAIAEEEGFSLSLAMRRIIDEWKQLRACCASEQPAISLTKSDS